MFEFIYITKYQIIQNYLYMFKCHCLVFEVTYQLEGALQVDFFEVCLAFQSLLAYIAFLHIYLGVAMAWLAGCCIAVLGPASGQCLYCAIPVCVVTSYLVL